MAYRFVVNSKRDKIVVKETNNIVKVDVDLHKIIVKPDIVNIRIHEYSRGPQGIPGPDGPVGPQGPVGPVGPDKNYIQNFITSSTVNVTHNLNKYPSTTVIDSAGDEVEGEVYHVNTSQMIVSFNNPFSGKIICN